MTLAIWWVLFLCSKLKSKRKEGIYYGKYYVGSMRICKWVCMQNGKGHDEIKHKTGGKHNE